MDNKQYPDTQQLALLRQQDHKAFTELVSLFHNSMLCIARSISGDWADEVVQDSWLAVYRALPDFQGRSSLKTWLFTIVRNQSIARLRKESRTESLDSGPQAMRGGGDNWPDEDFAADGRWQNPPQTWYLNTPEALLEEDELRKCIRHTLSLLNQRQQAVFTLADLQQMSPEEICNILDLSHSNFRVLLHRARTTLMQVIDRYQRTGTC